MSKYIEEYEDKNKKGLLTVSKLELEEEDLKEIKEKSKSKYKIIEAKQYISEISKKEDGIWYRFKGYYEDMSNIYELHTVKALQEYIKHKEEGVEVRIKYLSDSEESREKERAQAYKTYADTTLKIKVTEKKENGKTKEIEERKISITNYKKELKELLSSLQINTILKSPKYILEYTYEEVVILRLDVSHILGDKIEVTRVSEVGIHSYVYELGRLGLCILHPQKEAEEKAYERMSYRCEHIETEYNKLEDVLKGKTKYELILNGREGVYVGITDKWRKTILLVGDLTYEATYARETIQSKKEEDILKELTERNAIEKDESLDNLLLRGHSNYISIEEKGKKGYKLNLKGVVVGNLCVKTEYKIDLKSR